MNKQSVKRWYALGSGFFLYADQKERIRMYTWLRFAAHNERILSLFNALLLAEAERNPISPS